MRQRKVQRMRKILALAFFFVFFCMFARAFKLATGLGEIGENNKQIMQLGEGNEEEQTQLAVGNEEKQTQLAVGNEEEQTQLAVDNEEEQAQLATGNEEQTTQLVEGNEEEQEVWAEGNTIEEQAQTNGQTVLEQMAESQVAEEKGFFERLFSDKKDMYTIHMKDEITEQDIPLEDFLIGALSANIDAAYELETLKAQAVLLRGNCLLKMNQKSTIDYEELDIAYINMEQMQLLWGNDFREKYKRVRQAVKDTQGVIAVRENTILNGNFHAMSAGKTRSGEENFADTSYSYLQSVACDKNIEHAAFLQERIVKKTLVNDLTVIERDSAGYVKKARLNGNETGGEEIREALGLASSNFEVTQEGDEIIIRTKGVGHGFGFDQCYANYKAVHEGADYMALLSYFFQDVSFTTYDFHV